MNGEVVDIKSIGDSKALRDLLGEILPEFDRDRVHDSDIRKLLQWYNALISAGITEFKSTEKEETTENQ